MRRTTLVETLQRYHHQALSFYLDADGLQPVTSGVRGELLILDRMIFKLALSQQQVFESDSVAVQDFAHDGELKAPCLQDGLFLCLQLVNVPSEAS